jgi:hypothetical protein
MASRSRSSKKPEAVASKSIDDISKDLLNLQNNARLALAQIDGAFVAKQTELVEVLEAIKEAKAELEEVHGKATLAAEIRDLEDTLEDAKRDHGRGLAQLKVEHEDAVAAQAREFRIAKVDEARRVQDEERARRLAREDEDRKHAQQVSATEAALAEQVKDLAKQREELGSFDDRVKAQVAKVSNSIKRELEFKAKTAETENGAVVSILEAKVKQFSDENEALKNRLTQADAEAQKAAERTNAIAIASLDKESGKAALDELRAVSHKQAEAKR